MTQSLEQSEKIQFFNFILKAVFLMLKIATMSESKVGSKFKKNNKRWGKKPKCHSGFYLKLILLAKL